MKLLALSITFFLAAALASADEVVLKDGSRVIGEILGMEGGKLKVKTVFAKEIEIDWAQVATVLTDKPIPFHLKDGTVLNGPGVKGPDGQITVQTKEFANPLSVNPADVVAVNPAPKPTITFKGFVSAGATINDGNTQNRALTGTAEFVARSERQRFTARGIYNYGDTSGELTARNSRGTLKYDFFVTKRLYTFASALFEYDDFQDLRLRTALSAGPGYQFIDKGDFTEWWNKELQLSGEAGLAYFDEDYMRGNPDKAYVAARWAVNILWPVLPQRIILFHNHEGYPSLESGHDFYIVTEQGVRLSIVKNFFASFQVNWRYTSNPPDGLEKNDTVYLLTLGYNFEFAE